MDKVMSQNLDLIFSENDYIYSEIRIFAENIK